MHVHSATDAKPFQYLFHEIPLVILPFQRSDKSKCFICDFKYDQSTPLKQTIKAALLSLRKGLQYDQQVRYPIKSHQTSDKGCMHCSPCDKVFSMMMQERSRTCWLWLRRKSASRGASPTESPAPDVGPEPLQATPSSMTRSQRGR